MSMESHEIPKEQDVLRFFGELSGKLFEEFSAHRPVRGRYSHKALGISVRMVRAKYLRDGHSGPPIGHDCAKRVPILEALTQVWTKLSNPQQRLGSDYAKRYGIIGQPLIWKTWPRRARTMFSLPRE